MPLQQQFLQVGIATAEAITDIIHQEQQRYGTMLHTIGMGIGAATVPIMGMYGILPLVDGMGIGAANVMILGTFAITGQAAGLGTNHMKFNS